MKRPKYMSTDSLPYAIVFRASRDYVKALRDEDSHTTYECEQFFRSQWFVTLTNADGEALIEKLRKEALS